MPSVSHGPNQTEAEKEHDAVRKERLEQKVRRRFGETASIGDCVETVDGRRFDVRGDFDVTLQKIKELESAMGSGCRVMLQKIRGSDGYKMSVELPKTFRKRLSACEWTFLLCSILVMVCAGGMIAWGGV
jgi:hypothetical protein